MVDLKKMLLILLAVMLFLLPETVSAEGILLLPEGTSDGREAVAEAAAAVLGLTAGTEPDEDLLLNRTAAESGMLLLDTQSAIIRCLQGYTDGEFDELFIPVARAGSEALYLVMTAQKAEETGITDLGSFLDYVTGNEYEFLLARYPDAGIKDMAATEISNEIAVFTDYYYDEEIADALADDEIQLALLSESELAEARGDLLILCSLEAERSAARPELPTLAEAGVAVTRGIRFYLLTSAVSDAGFVSQTAEKLAAADAETVTGEQLAEEIGKEAEEIEAYLTSEGLFFYR